MRKQLEQQQIQSNLQRELFEQQGKQNPQQIEAIVSSLQGLVKPNDCDGSAEFNQAAGHVVETSVGLHYSVPAFPAFEPSKELWGDYYLKLQTFVKAHSVPNSKLA